MNRREFIKKTAVATAGAAMATPVSAVLAGLGASGRARKVLLVNGSPRPDGNTFCCLKEIEKQLQRHGVASEIVQIGRQPVRMCINCGGCRQNDGAGCVFDDDLCAVVTQKMADADALDTEGMQTMRTLATNMAFLLGKIHADGHAAPKREEQPVFMNFIRQGSDI